MRIDLKLVTKYDLELLEQNVEARLIRLFSDVRFLRKEDTTKEYRAIIDTGSPISLIPLSIWHDIDFELLSNKEFPLLGIASKESNPILAKIAKVKFVLVGRSGISSPVLEAKSYLVPTDHVPLLLGFEDVLTDSTLFCDYKSNTAYIEV